MTDQRLYQIRAVKDDGRPYGSCLAVVGEAGSRQEALRAFLEDHRSDIRGIEKIEAFRVKRRQALGQRGEIQHAQD